jgi:Flp pilus assembly protein TadG
LTIPALVVAVAMAVDYGVWTGQARKLQGIADAAAIAAARELYLANASDSQIASVAELVARAQLENSGHATQGLTVATHVQRDRDAVEVSVSQPRKIYFSQVLGTEVADIAANATARAAGGGRVCVVGLDDYTSGTVQLEGGSRLTAPECGVYSNSRSSSGIDVSGQSMLDAELVCSAGGVDGSAANFGAADPLTDCPRIRDPLSDRPAPEIGSCDHRDLYLVDNKALGGLIGLVTALLSEVVLFPGTYCGGMIFSKSHVILMPGTYVVKDGPLEFKNGSIVIGLNVGFYLHGDDAVLRVDADTLVELTAQVAGPMAGLIIFEDRDAPLDREHVIRSNDASLLLGTFYLPRGIFVVDTNSPVAKKSAYTAIVARRLVLRRRPNLYLNADYDDTDVPVPDGIGRVGGNIVLER